MYMGFLIEGCTLFIEARERCQRTTTIGTNVSSTVTGTQITMRATTVNTLFGSNSTLVSTLTITGLDSGARITVPVTITRSTT